ncbi:MAG: flagellar hook-associated family protein [Hyphomicrobium sp.]
MIYPTFVSTSSLTSETKTSISRIQSRLIESQGEMTSGRLADVGLTLGSKTGLAVNLRQQQLQATTLRDTNTMVATRLKATQLSLQNISDLTQNYLGTVVRGQATISSSPTLVAEARSALTSLGDAINVSIDGQYLLSGINSDVRPVQGYFASPPSDSRQAVAAAFQAEFGFAQADPAAASITNAQMTAFLDNRFSAEFADPNWSANWSAASDRNVRSRISRLDLVETSTNANEQVFRDLTASMVMIADLGFEGLNDNARQAIIDKAVKLTGAAVGGIADLQSNLGVTQERVTTSSKILDLQVNQVSKLIDDLESVDPTEVATRIGSLMTQLEGAYSITKRMHDLSLLNYL